MLLTLNMQMFTGMIIVCIYFKSSNINEVISTKFAIFKSVKNY